MNEELIAIVLARYLGEFIPADEQTAEFRKNSAEIAEDLEDIITLTVDIITEAMIHNKFTLSFDDDKPVWLMKKREPESIPINP